MIIDIIENKVKYLPGTKLSSLCVQYILEHGMEDLVYNGREFEIPDDPDYMLYKYKIIEKFDDIYSERTILTFNKIDLNFTKPQSIDIFQILVKQFHPKFKLGYRGYWLVNGINGVLDVLQYEDKTNRVPLDSMLLANLFTIASNSNDYHEMNIITDYYNNTPLSFEDTLPLVDTAVVERYRVIRGILNSGDRLQDEISNALTYLMVDRRTDYSCSTTDILSDSEINNKDTLNKMHALLYRPIYNQRLFNQMWYSVQPFTVDASVITTVGPDNRYELMKLVSVLNAFLFTDFCIDINLNNINDYTVEMAINRYMPQIKLEMLAIKYRMYETVAYAIRAFITSLIMDATFVNGIHNIKDIQKVRLYRSWEDEVYITIIDVDGNATKIFIDLIVMGLGTYMLLDNCMTFRELTKDVQ